MSKTTMRIAVILLLLGLLATLLTAGLTARMLWIQQEMDAVESHIVSITRERRSNGDRHTVMIRYVYDGQSHTVRYNTYYATMKVGDPITIYVDPEQPSRYYQPNVFTHVIMPGIFAVTLTAVGLPFYIVSRKNKKAHSALVGKGKKETAVITEVHTRKMTITINGRPHRSKQIVCQVTDEDFGLSKTYTSRRFLSPLYDSIQEGTSTVDVWIDRQDKENYFVDTDSIKHTPNNDFDASL